MTGSDVYQFRQEDWRRGGGRADDEGARRRRRRRSRGRLRRRRRSRGRPGTGGAVLHLLALLPTERFTERGGFVSTDCFIGDPLALSHQPPALNLIRLTLLSTTRLWLGL